MTEQEKGDPLIHVTACDCITEVAAWTGWTVLAIIQEETFNVQKVVIFVMIYDFFIHIKLSVFNLGQWHAYMGYVYLAKLGDELCTQYRLI